MNQELLVDHAWARSTVSQLVYVTHRYEQGEHAVAETAHRLIQALLEFRPKHIAKEDKQFFIPVMSYFTPEEQAAMLAEGYEFDQKLTHEHYKGIVESVEHGIVM